MNKKMVTIIAALAMCTAMAGCTGNDTASSSKAETTTTTTAAAESAAPAESTADESPFPPVCGSKNSFVLFTVSNTA